MNDTSAAISKVVVERYRSMTPAERWLAASSLFETARQIVESSLPSGLTIEQRRLAVARRLYKNELPEVALIAHAEYLHSSNSCLTLDAVTLPRFHVHQTHAAFTLRSKSSGDR